MSVRRALEEPLRQIAENAGFEGSVVVNKVKTLPKGHGFNAATEDYGDMVAAGVIDPVKVTRSALQNAASTASPIGATETLVVEKPEKKSAAPRTDTAAWTTTCSPPQSDRHRLCPSGQSLVLVGPSGSNGEQPL